MAEAQDKVLAVAGTAPRVVQEEADPALVVKVVVVVKVVAVFNATPARQLDPVTPATSWAIRSVVTH